MSRALVLRERMDVVEGGSEDFHLQFAAAPFDSDLEETEVNIFLRNIFNGASTLAYEGFRTVQTDGEQQAAQVRFKLSNVGLVSNTSFDDAARELCRRLFDPSSRHWLHNVSAKGILGISAVSLRWRGWFNQAFFAAASRQGPQLLEEVVATFTEDYLPPWAMILSFAVVVGLNIAAIPGVGVPGSENEGLRQLLGETGVRSGRQILAAFATRRSLRPQGVIEREWRADHDRYVACMGLAIDAIAQYADTNDVVVEDDLKSVRLINALCEMAHSAAKTLTINKEMLEAFIASLDSAKKENALAQVAAFTSFGLMQAGRTALEGAAVATVRTLAVPGLTLAAGVVGTIYFLYTVGEKAKEIEKFNKNIEFHKEVGVFIIQTWQLAFDTERFLEWVYCTNMAQPSPVDGVSAETRQDWQQFLGSVQRATGEIAVNREMVNAYLQLRRTALAEIRESVKVADRAANPEAYN